MRFSNTLNYRGKLIVLVCFPVASAMNQTLAIDNFWTGRQNDSWNVTSNWNFSGSPAPLPRIPADIDTAILSSPSSDQVSLYGDTAPINGLEIYNNIDLFTNSHFLDVDNNGAATTLVSGNGSFLIVRDTLNSGLDFRTDILEIKSGGSLRLDGDADVHVEGSTVISGGRLFDTSGTTTAPVQFGGDVTVSNGGLLGQLPQAPTNFTAFSFAAGSTLSVESAAELRLKYQNNLISIANGQQWRIDGGTFVARNDIKIDGGALFVVGGGILELDNSKSLTVLDGGAATFEDPLVIEGTRDYHLEGGQFTANSISFADSGEFHFTGGTLSVRMYNSSLVNNGGAVAPGSPTGDTTISGHYIQNPSGKLQIDIGGPGMGADYDLVSVTGNAQLDGELEVALLNGFVPSPSDKFVVLNSANLSGFFDNAGNGGRLTTSDGDGSFRVNYGFASPFDPDQIVLNDFQPISADLDNDGDVDGHDFLLIQRTNPALISLWQTQFGTESLSIVQAVPEPNSVVLTGLALGGITLVRRLCCT